MTQPGAPLLGEVFDIPPVVAASDFVLQLQEGVERPERTVGDYVVTDSIAAAFDRALDYVGSALTTRQDRGVFLHGNFGSGKSHFMAVLDLLLRGEPVARAVPGLQATVARHEDTLNRRLLTIEYHLIGADSLESALFSGYLKRVAQLHPDQPAPMLHRSDALFRDAANRRRADEAGFFAELNSGSTGGSGWGSFVSTWTPDSFDAAVAADVADPERQRLAADLVATMFAGYVSAGQWLDISEGLGVMTRHARGLGYEGLVLFLDELVLWLASRLGDQEFVASEGAKVAKLVETGMGQRAIPITSFVARQRELQDFYADTAGAGVGGAEKMMVGQSFQYWENRYDTITLESSDLPDIAHRRLLRPVDDEAGRAVAAALLRLKSHQVSWDALLRDEAGSDEAAFAKVYPFSPALVDTLVFLSGLLQRERTALKVMAQLLSQRRDSATIDQIIPVADLFDALVVSGEQPLTDEVRHQFELARRLYQERFRPMLLESHSLTEAEVPDLPAGHPLFADDRLAKTLLISALVSVPALKDLTATKLAALNHGSVTAFIPGTEGAAVLTKVRPWAEQIAELEISEGADPVISLALTGVDYESVLSRVSGEDTPGARRRLMRGLVFEQLGVTDPDDLFGSVVDHKLAWRGSKRTIQLVFGNIRDQAALPDDVLRAEGDTWRVVVDYPFDVAGHVPGDDVVRFEELRAAGVVSRTVGWVPRFLSAARQDDLGTLVSLEYLLGGLGDQFDANSRHLPVEQRDTARTMLANKRKALRESLVETMKQAYGVAEPQPVNIDLSSGDLQTWPTLDPELQVQPLVGATLGAALVNLADQMLASQYPEHPRFEKDVTGADLKLVLEYVTKAVAAGTGRVDPVPAKERERLRKVANPLGCGKFFESHFVFSAETFGWRNDFIRLAGADDTSAGVGVPQIRKVLAGRGMAREVENLLIAAWALLDDKQYRGHGAPVQVTSLRGITDELTLVDPVLPEQQQWDLARNAAGALFGVAVGKLRSAANLTALGSGVRQVAGQRAAGCVGLLEQLDQHRATLGIDPDCARMRTAATAAELVPGLAAENDDMVLAGMLAGFRMPAEPQALAKSISSAATVAGELSRAAWSVLDAVAGIGAPEADAALAKLREAAARDELHAPLGIALGESGTRASSYLAATKQTPPPPPSPPPPPPSPPDSDPEPEPKHVNDITIAGVDDEFGRQIDGMRAALEQAMRAQPRKKLRVKWWLE